MKCALREGLQWKSFYVTEWSKRLEQKAQAEGNAQNLKFCKLKQNVNKKATENQLLFVFENLKISYCTPQKKHCYRNQNILWLLNMMLV